nr:LysR family transcriptional regulator [Endozoicomonas sp. G2_1]
MVLVLNGNNVDFVDCSKAFLLVSEHKNFKIAAEKMGSSASTVSKKVRYLENQLKTNLLVRTTRRVTLTETGELFAKKMKYLLAELDETVVTVKQLSKQPQGKLKVAGNTLIGSKIISPSLPSFLAKYPEIDIELSVLPIGSPPSSESDITITSNNYEIDSLSYRRIPLVSYDIGFYAAPCYLEGVTRIESIEDLEAQPFVLSKIYYQKRAFELSDGRKVRLNNARFVSDNVEALFENVLAGVGMFFAPDMFVNQYLKSGQLVRVLPEMKGPKSKMVALYPNLDFIPQKTRLFLDHIKEYTSKAKLLDA